MATAPASEHKKPASAPRPAAAEKGADKKPEGGDKKAGAQNFDKMTVRAKLAVSEPGDAVEREADAVADRVMRAPAPAAPEKKPAAPKPAAPGADVKRAAKPAADEKKPASPGIKRAAATGASSDANAPATGAELTGKLSGGEAMDAATRAFFEPRLGRSLGDVRIHTDASAAQVAQQLSARAFTYGNHIVFAASQYQPDSDSGKRLLAHELAHVLQNDDVSISHIVQRKKEKAEPKYADKDDVRKVAIDPKKDKAARPALETLKLPLIKGRHADLYKKTSSAKLLKRPMGYDREAPAFTTEQVKKWKDGIDISKHYKDIGYQEGVSGQTLMFKGAKPRPLTGQPADILEQLKVPKWAPDGTWFENGMQVDHIIEFQVNGQDAFTNFELLSGPHNGSAGSKLGQAIRAGLRTYLTAIDKNESKKNQDTFLAENDVDFKTVEGGGASKTNSEASAQFWSSAQINHGDHLKWLKDDAAEKKDDGTDKSRFALYSYTGAGLIDAFALRGTTVTINDSRRLHGIALASIKLDKGFEKATANASIGMLKGKWDLPKGVTGGKDPFEVAITAIAKKPYGGAMASLPPPPAADVTSASPVTFSEVNFLRGSVYADGTLTPTLAWLPAIPIPVRWRGDEFAFEHTFAASDLKLQLPGVVVEEASVTLSFGTRGLGADGTIAFRVKGFGAGTLSVGVRGGVNKPVFFAKGVLNADSKLFDEAAITLAYSTEDGFSGSGVLSIDSPDKIKGIKSARVAAAYANNVFTATGDVVPDIPGLKAASLAVTYSDHLVITGQLAIDDKVPGVEAADITVTVEEKGTGWAVAASGIVVPKLPGLSGATLAFSYVDGLVVVEGEFDIKKGPLEGKVKAGVTNAVVDPVTGKRGASGDNQTLTVYGNAKIKAVFIKDKFTGELDLRLLPDGSLRVGGALTVGDIDVFPKMPSDDELFSKTFSSPRMPIPGLGFSVAGVSVGVTFWADGFIRANASVGPGTLRGITVSVAEFDPAAIDLNTLEIGGGARFEVPANASLTLGANVNVGLSAAVVDLSGHIGVTATVAIPEDQQPVLKAATTFTYSAAKGLDVQSTIDLHLRPSLKFALVGGAKAELNLLIDTVTLWSKDWTLGEANFKLPVGIDISGALGYNSKTNKLTTEPSALAKVQKPELDKPDKMLSVIDGSGPAPDIQTQDKKGDVLPPGQLGSRAPDPAAANAPVMAQREDDYSSLQGGQPGKAKTGQLDAADLDALGGGIALDIATRGFFEQRMGRDLAQVRIFTGARADALAKKISARAFTVGHRIVFADGEYRPQHEDGKQLLAHELAHVGQQQDGAARTVMRAPPAPATPAPPAPAPPPPSAAPSTPAATAPAPAAAAASGDFIVSTPFEIPPIKARHAVTYELMAGQHVLRRPAGYSSATRGTGQMDGWLRASTADVNRVPAVQRPTQASGMSLILNTAGGAATRTITEPNLPAMNRRLKLPNWSASGADIDYQVDHMVEFQTGGADTIQNFELLNQAHNGSIGTSFNYEIKRAVRAEIQANPGAPQLAGYPGAVDSANRPTPEGVMQWKNILLTRTLVRARETGRREGGSSYWSRAQIDAMEHVLPLLGGARTLTGTATSFALLSPTGNLLISQFAHGTEELNINVGRRAAGSRGGIAGFTIDRVRLHPGYNAAAPETIVGDVVGNLDLGPQIAIPPATVTLPITQVTAGAFSGKIGAPLAGGPTQAEFTPMSPLDLASITYGQGVFGRAVLHPSHPALAGIAIPATIADGKVGLFYTVDAGMLAERLTVPGLTIDAAAITFGYDGSAFSVSGGAEFTVRNFGQGQLRAMVDSDGKFQLEGGFHADPRLFDRADMALWYRSGTGFGGSGTLAITNPNKIRGVRAASVTTTYDNGVFSAAGTVEPNIPGVQSAGLTVRYGPDDTGADALTIGGDLALAPGIPGVQGGQVHVDLAQRDNDWHVSGQGDIRPNLPGVDAVVHLEYADGIFDGRLNIDYARSIFSGNLLVGLTNRPVNPDGQPVAGGAPESALKLYGEGTLNARLTPWLQGGVGVKVRPTGQMLISGRIGIADAVEVFGQFPSPERARRDLFRMPTVSIPLVGIAVGGNTVGLALTINGLVEGHAHVGPGQLTQAEVRIDDFDPAQPETLHVSGDARFHVPAEAGVDASLDAGVSLGAAVIRATAGLNLRAGVVARADVATAAHLDWRPATGLHLHANLNTSVSPALRFSVNGYAEVVADAFVTSFSLWRKDWNLAQREIGSNLALGINAPVDYYSDERGVQFDPNAVSFQVPSLNADTLAQVANGNGSERVQP